MKPVFAAMHALMKKLEADGKRSKDQYTAEEARALRDRPGGPKARSQIRPR